MCGGHEYEKKARVPTQLLLKRCGFDLETNSSGDDEFNFRDKRMAEVVFGERKSSSFARETDYSMVRLMLRDFVGCLFNTAYKIKYKKRVTQANILAAYTLQYPKDSLLERTLEPIRTALCEQYFAYKPALGQIVCDYILVERENYAMQAANLVQAFTSQRRAVLKPIFKAMCNSLFYEYAQCDTPITKEALLFVQCLFEERLRMCLEGYHGAKAENFMRALPLDPMDMSPETRMLLEGKVDDDCPDLEWSEGGQDGECDDDDDEAVMRAGWEEEDEYVDEEEGKELEGGAIEEDDVTSDEDDDDNDECKDRKNESDSIEFILAGSSIALHRSPEKRKEAMKALQHHTIRSPAGRVIMMLDTWERVKVKH
eukprot:jgi/Bigna1/74579/fgenesh1_pg.29_\